MQSHACTRYVSDLPLSLCLSFCDLSYSLPLIEPTPPLPPPPPSFLTCRECVSAIAACTDADTLPRAEVHKEVFNIDEPVPLASPGNAARRVSTLPLFRRSCESLQRHGVHSTPSCTLRHDTIRSADRLCHPTAFNLILLFLLLLLRRALYLVSVHLLLIYPCLHAWYTQEQEYIHMYGKRTTSTPNLQLFLLPRVSSPSAVRIHARVSAPPPHTLV